MVSLNRISSIHILLAGIFILCGQSLPAQSLSISSSDDTITSDQQFIIVLDGELGNFSNFATLPDVPGLVIISHNESFNYNASNKNAIVHQSYVMKAITPGDYTIGPAWIQAGTRRVYSNTLHIHVTAGDNPIGNGTIFLRCEPEKKNVYTGEKVKVRVRLYFPEDIYVSGDYPIANSYSGFWKGEDQKYSYDNEYGSYNDSTVYLKGKRYICRTLLTESLYPNAVGEIPLPTYTYSCYLNGDDDPYSYDSYDMSFDIISEQSSISCLPLPDHDTLPGFSGDVGEFEIKCTLSSDSTRAWEPVAYVMWVTGEGNFQFMMAPTLTLPTGLRAQTTMNSDTNVFKNGEYIPAKVFRYLITPEKEGEYDLSRIAYSYFDPEKKEYVTLFSDSFHLHVDPGIQIDSETVSNLPDSFFTKKARKNTALIITICAVLVIGPVIGFIIVRRRKKKRLAAEAEKERLAKEQEIPEYIPPPDASREQANALVHGAGQYLQSGLVLQCVNNLYEAMVVRIAGVTKMRREEISVNTLRYRLKLAKLSDDVISAILEQYEDLKLKRYTLSPADGAAAHILIVRTADLLRKMG